MTVAFASLFVLGWVAYSSVVVIFKEQIITAKNQRYASMQAAYEGRISQMQLQYDELNGLLVLLTLPCQRRKLQPLFGVAAIETTLPVG